MLRAVWEALLEDASGCVDEARQPKVLQRVQVVLAWCVEAGISVKYGRKVSGGGQFQKDGNLRRLRG
jgi:hypothetical protein